MSLKKKYLVCGKYINEYLLNILGRTDCYVEICQVLLCFTPLMIYLKACSSEAEDMNFTLSLNKFELNLSLNKFEFTTTKT